MYEMKLLRRQLEKLEKIQDIILCNSGFEGLFESLETIDKLYDAVNDTVDEVRNKLKLKEKDMMDELRGIDIPRYKIHTDCIETIYRRHTNTKRYKTKEFYNVFNAMVNSELDYEIGENAVVKHIEIIESKPKQFDVCLISINHGTNREITDGKGVLKTYKTLKGAMNFAKKQNYFIKEEVSRENN